MIENVDHSHPRVPSLYARIVRQFEGIIDARVERRETRPFDVDCRADGPSPFPSIRVGRFEGMGGVVGIFLGVYVAREFSRNSGVAPTSEC